LSRMSDHQNLGGGEASHSDQTPAASTSEPVPPPPTIAAAPAAPTVANTEPPRGRDPNSHHTDTASTLAAAAQSLSSPGSKTPKIAAIPQLGDNVTHVPPAAQGLGQNASTANNGKHASGSADRESPVGTGKSEINHHLVTKDYLTAVSASFYTDTADTLHQNLTAIVPFFAACRAEWLSRDFSGNMVVLSETPESLEAVLNSLTKASGERLLTANETKFIVVLIAKMVTANKLRSSPTTVWVNAVPPESKVLIDLPLFVTLNELQTFEFVTTLCPHLAKHREAWVTHGLTGRELADCAPQLLVDTTANFHTVMNNNLVVLPMHSQRMREAIYSAIKQHFENGEQGLTAIFAAHEAYHNSYLSKYKTDTAIIARGGGAAETIHTPSGNTISTFNPTPSTAGDNVTFKAAEQVKPAKLAFETENGDTSFMSQIGPVKTGSRLRSDVAGDTTITHADGKMTITTAASVVSNYKLFERYTHNEWELFMKRYRDETTRLPKASRRTLKELVTPTCIESFEDDNTFDDWDLLTDDQIVEFGFKKFGPKSSHDAQTRWTNTKFYFNDATMHQSMFSGRLSAFFTEKRVMLADFQHSAKKWKLGDSLTPYMMREALKEMFPVDETIDGPDGKIVPKSSNNARVRMFVRENSGKTIHEIMKLIKNHFTDRDTSVATTAGCGYEVTPWKKLDAESATEPPKKRPAYDDRDRRVDNVQAKPRQTAGLPKKSWKKEAPKKDVTKKRPLVKLRCNNCGRKGHRANKDECRLWGHKDGKGANGTWADDERSLQLSNEDYATWCQEHPEPKAKKHAGGKANGPVKSAQYECARAQEAAIHASPDAAPQNSTRTRNIASIDLHDATTAFHAIGRFPRARHKRSDRTMSVLMDPGAEINLIRTELISGVTPASAIKVLDEKADPIDLFNNGKHIGSVNNAYLLQFTLDTVEGVATQTYEAWFHAWKEMSEDAILGAEFNRAACFTNYHMRLVPYSAVIPIRAERADADNTASTAGPNTDRQWQWAMPRRPGEEFMPGGITQERVRDACPHQQQILSRTKSEAEHKQKHKIASAEATAARSQHPWMCRPINRPTNISQLQPVSRANHKRVNYNAIESMQLALHLARSHCNKQQQILKRIESVGKGKEDLTAEEHDVITDAARACAKESADFFECNAHLLGGNASTIKPHSARYFLDEPFVPKETPASANPDATESERKFPNRHICVLQNLVNKPELNGTAARIVGWDTENKVYHIGIANPRSYWSCREEFLRSLDPPPAAKSALKSAGEPNLTFADCGVDTESGQPTLDPLERPVHRQYGKQVSEALTQKINAILKKYEEVFGKDITKPCKFRPMKIELVPNAVLPANPRFWRNSPEQRKEVRVQLQSMLDMRIVQASDTAVVSNVLMVKRPGMPGKFRFTVDMRTLNEATKPMPWQMPEVQQQLDRLAGNSIFGCIDLSSYYHQIELEKGSRFLTGFITEDGVFEYNRVAMGLKNACAHAQSCLQKAIDEDPVLNRLNVRNYFDDIPLAAKSEDEFCELLEAILALGKRMDLKFNREKSIFGVDSITHVGFVVRNSGVEVDPMRVEALREITAPKSMKGTQSVLGAWNYIRNFIPNFSSRALPLTELVGSVKGANGKKKPKPFVWTDRCQGAFDDLKAATLDTKLLGNIDFTKEIFIRCDSSQFGAGAVLFQINEHGQEVPIAYASRKYTLAERNYCTFQQEAGAVVWALEKFACFFQGHPVTVQSDHKNLSWVKKSAMPQLTRWRLRLQDFDFRLEYLPGPLNICADGLSRIGVDDRDMLISIADVLPAHAAEQSLLNSQSVPYRSLNNIYANKKRGHDRQQLRTAAETVWNAHADDDTEDESAEPAQRDGRAEFHPISAAPAGRENIVVQNEQQNVDFIESDDEEGGEPDPEAQALEPVDQPPAIDADEIIKTVHNDIVGHSGVLTTLQRVLRTDKQWASRSKMIEDIDAFLSGCTTCQKFRKRHNKNAQQRFTITGSPFAELSVDILQLPKRDCNQNLYVVVIIDSFTRWLTCVPTQDKSALSAARALIQCIGTFGVPLTIRSDGGGEFINDTLSAFEAIMGIKHHKIAPYLHEGNSLAEKANRSVLENLRNLIFDKRYDLNGEHQWSDLLPLAQRIINASYNSSIGCAPAQLVFGDNVELDRCLLTAMPEAVTADTPTYIQQLARNQRVMFDAASKILDSTHAKNLKAWKESHKSDTSLQQMLQAAPEDGVWVLARVRDDAPIEKWKPRWAGPFRLLDFKSQTQSMVRLWDTVNNKVIEAHLNDVELWNHKFTDSVEGLTKVAEYDGWVYPMDGIIGMAVTPANPEDEHIPLNLSLPREKGNKYSYSFSIKWRNYAEPSWVKYSAIKDTSTFQVWAAAHPVLKF
jgi:hypothetical protein